MLNKITLIGRLTKDVEMRTTQNGTAVATFTVACERNFKGQDGEKETDFIPIIVWKGLAETCNRFLAKGKMVAVAGRLQIRNYEDKEGKRRTVAEVVAEDVQFLTPKLDGGYIEPAEQMPLDDDIPF